MWIIVVACFAAGVVVIVAISHHVAKMRREALATLAAELGFTFEAKSQGEFLGPAASFEVFKTGHSRKFLNVLSGTTADLQVAIFDFSYAVQTGQHSHVHTQTCVAFHFPQKSDPSTSTPANNPRLIVASRKPTTVPAIAWRYILDSVVETTNNYP